MLYICSAEPTNYTQASSTYALGNKTSLSIGAPADRSPDGRKVTVASFTDGTVTGTNSATHWAITKSGTTLMATAVATTPTVGAPAILQKHSLTAIAVTTTPVIDIPVIVIVRHLDATGIASSPTVGTPRLRPAYVFKKSSGSEFLLGV